MFRSERARASGALIPIGFINLQQEISGTSKKGSHLPNHRSAINSLPHIKPIKRVIPNLIICNDELAIKEHTSSTL